MDDIAFGVFDEPDEENNAEVQFEERGGQWPKAQADKVSGEQGNQQADSEAEVAPGEEGEE